MIDQQKTFPTPEQMLTCLRNTDKKVQMGPPSKFTFKPTHVGQYDYRGQKVLVNIWAEPGLGFTINAFRLNEHGDVVLDSEALGVVLIQTGDQRSDPVETIFAAAEREGITDIIAL